MTADRRRGDLPTTKILIPTRGAIQLPEIVLPTMRLADWRLVQVRREGSFRFMDPLPLSPVMPTADNWDVLVVQGVLRVSAERYIGSQSRNKSLVFPSVVGPTEASTHLLQTAVNHERRINDSVNKAKDLDQKTYKAEKMRVLRRLVSYLKDKSALSAIRDAWLAVDRASEEGADLDAVGLLSDNIRAIHLMVGSPDRVLAGFEGSVPLWKRVELPQIYEETGVPVFHAGTPFIELIDSIKSPDLLEILPTKIPEPGVKKFSIPDSRPVDESFYRAHYYQRFMMHPEGVNLIPRGDSDIAKMKLVESNGWIMALSETKSGDQLTTALNIETGEGYSSEMMSAILSGLPMGESILKSALARYVADTYAAYLCDEKNPRRLKVLRGRLKYEGEPRPVEPHIRRGHLRLVGEKGMTLDQLDKVEEFLESGLKVPKPKYNQTVVSPSIVPEGGKVTIATAPPVVREVHQRQAGMEFKDGGEVLTLDMIDQIREEIIARRAQFAK